jgi:hypothetical protein
VPGASVPWLAYLKLFTVPNRTKSRKGYTGDEEQGRDRLHAPTNRSGESPFPQVDKTSSATFESSVRV